MQFLGIDYGKSKVGLALGDDITKLAFGFKTIKNKGFDELLNELKTIIKQEEIESAVLGKPVNLKGEDETPGELARLFDALAEVIEVKWQDERFSTKQAESLAKEIPEKRDKVKLVDDKLAAMIILQAYLDKS
ncbi:MAG TPA: Holliday junction resolvase RuvX [Candidatus Bipolaricaulota bacterium]|nr:Holliday junction resolvase RuvX [Candidatus Bipolaricaulota bacterium]